MKHIQSRTLLATTILLLATTSRILAQDAVPTEILQRTFLIKVGNVTGTAFTIDHNGKLYLVTARHVIAGLPAIKATFQVWRSDKWESIHTVKTFLPMSNEVDVAVFETDEGVATPFGVATTGEDEGPTLGQQVWFLGYPFGDTTMTSRLGNGNLPFIKRGIISAIHQSGNGAVLLYIDGFNNPGFSGGPIVYWEFKKHAYRVLGVVNAFRLDTAKVIVDGKPVDSSVLINSGILIGTSISDAIKTLDRPARSMVPAKREKKKDTAAAK